MKLKDYIKGDRKGRDAWRTELDAMADPFLGEALEGFDSVGGDHGEALDRLAARLAERTRESVPVRRIPVWRRPAVWAGAAAIILCLVISGVIYRSSLLPVTEYTDVPTLETLPKVDTSRVISEMPTPEPQEEKAAEVPVPEPPRIVSIDVISNDTRIRVSEDISAEFSGEAAGVTDAPETRKIIIRGTSPQKSEDSEGDATVRGRVVGPDLKPMAGVVVIADKGNGALTDTEGNFELRNVKDKTQLTASMLGYEKAEVEVGREDGPVVIAMQESKSQLDDIVVVGYGSKERRMVTGSTTRMDHSDMQSEAALPQGSIHSESIQAAPLVRGRHTYPGSGRFVNVTDAPVSSFGLDVTGNSYQVVKRKITGGNLPAPSDVRTEEMINHFSNGLSRPTGDGFISISSEAAPCPWNTAHMLVRITVMATGSIPVGDIAAQDVRLEVEFDPAVVRSYRLSGYDNGLPVDVQQPGQLLKSGDPVTALYEVIPVGSAVNSDLLTIRMTYKEAGKRSNRSVRATAKYTGAEPSADFYFASAVAMFGKMLTNPVFKAGTGYDILIETARKGVSGERNGERSEFIRLVEAARELDERK